LDKEFRDWHNDKVVVGATNLNREWKRRGVQDVGYIIIKPIADIVLGFASGISGVVILPIKGFQRSGSAGFIIGMGAGVIGIVAKPMVRHIYEHVVFVAVKIDLNIFYFVVRSVCLMLRHTSLLQSMILLKVLTCWTDVYNRS
jgi:hypothetical protein